MSEDDARTGLIGELLTAYRDLRVSPVEVVTEALRRAEATQPTLQAMVLLDADGALAAAREAEQVFLRREEGASLLGVPVVIKDIFDVRGMPTRCGSLSRDDAPDAADDAAAVKAWRRAGAVIVGKSVTQEFAAGVLSPPARNPWDASRVPGGSSGGSAVAVAVRIGTLGLGSDTGGSIRIPASAVGVTGFKPTYGTIPTGGCFPLSWSLDTVGPLGRTAEDVEIGWQALTKPSGPWADHASGELTGLRIGLPRRHFLDRVAVDVAQAVEAAAETLRGLGAEIDESDWADAAAARDCAFIINRVETAAVHDATRREAPARFARMNSDLQLRVAAGAKVAASDYLLALQARSVIRDSMARYFAARRLDAVLVPALPDVAVRADSPVVVIDGHRESAGLAYTRLTMPFNATGQPVLSLPAGFSAGLPIGVQLAGVPGRESVLFRLGRAYQAATDWHLMRPPHPFTGPASSSPA